jgi:hypothetical protein
MVNVDKKVAKALNIGRKPRAIKSRHQDCRGVKGGHLERLALPRWAKGRRYGVKDGYQKHGNITGGRTKTTDVSDWWPPRTLKRYTWAQRWAK